MLVDLSRTIIDGIGLSLSAGISLLLHNLIPKKKKKKSSGSINACTLEMHSAANRSNCYVRACPHSSLGYEWWRPYPREIKNLLLYLFNYFYLMIFYSMSQSLIRNQTQHKHKHKHICLHNLWKSNLRPFICIVYTYWWINN